MSDSIRTTSVISPAVQQQSLQDVRQLKEEKQDQGKTEEKDEESRSVTPDQRGYLLDIEV